MKHLLLDEEEWRWIAYNPMYAISDLGRVYNTKRESFVGMYVSRHGYERVTLMVDDHPRKFFVHRLVAETFLRRPPGTTQVNHIDGDKRYNVVDNLEWVTASENSKHAYDNGLRVAPNKRSVRVVETGDIFDSISSCAEAIGGIPQGVHNCLTGRARTHCRLTFEYLE